MIKSNLTKRNYKSSHNALLLSGGGARAAYQVGVLSAITKFVPRNHGIPFPILCGTSAGSINTTALACYASCFHLGVKKLEWVWKNLSTDKIYQSNTLGIFGHIGKGLVANLASADREQLSKSLLNNAPLQDLLGSILDFSRIDKNIQQNYLTAISVTASSYTSGKSICFYQATDKIQPWNRHKRHGFPCKINSKHLMASSAIPLIFPSIKIDDEHFGDGAIHQLSPLSPAIHLGAKNILVIGVKQPEKDIQPTDVAPTSSAIAGHLLDSVFSDTLYGDLERMNRINETLSHVNKKKKSATDSLQHINSLIITPSQDINAIASNHYDDLPLPIRLLLRSVGVNNESDSSIISYLLFEKNYCNELIKLGFNDAMEKEQDIINFLTLNEELPEKGFQFKMLLQQLFNPLRSH